MSRLLANLLLYANLTIFFVGIYKLLFADFIVWDAFPLLINGAAILFLSDSLGKLVYTRESHMFYITPYIGPNGIGWLDYRVRHNADKPVMWIKNFIPCVRYTYDDFGCILSISLFNYFVGLNILDFNFIIGEFS